MQITQQAPSVQFTTYTVYWT